MPYQGKVIIGYQDQLYLLFLVSVTLPENLPKQVFKAGAAEESRTSGWQPDALPTELLPHLKLVGVA